MIGLLRSRLHRYGGRLCLTVVTPRARRTGHEYCTRPKPYRAGVFRYTLTYSTTYLVMGAFVLTICHMPVTYTDRQLL